MTTRAPAVDFERATWRVRISLLAIVVYFGGSLPAYKLAGASFGPATTNLIRFTIAAAMLMVVGRRHLTTAFAARQTKRLLVLGVFGIGVMAVLMSIGVDRGSATIGSIVVGLEPIGVALCGVLLVGDKPRPAALIALGIGFTGALVASGVFTEKTGPSPVVPIVLLLGTVLAFSLYTAYVRKTPKQVHPLAVAALTQLGGLMLVIPACLLDVADGGMLRGDGITGKALAAAVFIGVGSAVAYLLLCLVLTNQPSSGSRCRCTSLRCSACCSRGSLSARP